MQPLKWAIMGTDLIADEFADHLAKRGDIFAAASPDQERLKSFSEKYTSVKTYTSYDALLNDPAIDIVYVSTLGDEHYTNIMACLNHGKHVFCEKTMLGSITELRNAIRLAKEKDLFLGEAMTIFYMPLYEQIRNMIRQGVIGNMKMVRADFGSLKEETPGNPLFSREKKGGALMDVGIYALTFVFHFMSSFPTEHIHFQKLHPSGVDETWNIILKNKEGELANVNLCLRAKLPKRAIIAGDKAYFIIDSYNRADRADLVFPDGRIEELHEGNSADAVTYEIFNVENAILNHQYESSKLQLTEKVVELMDKLLSSIGDTTN